MPGRALPALFLATALVAGAGARAEPPGPASVVTVVAYTYLPGDIRDPRVPLRMDEGGELRLVNADIDLHSVVAADTAGGRPIFSSDLIGIGHAAPVRGVERLEPGTYRFYCHLHPDVRGDLEVVPAGAVSRREPR